MRTYVYIDGFNFYYGALKGTSAKWLDLMALLTKLLQPHHQILKIKYFTATVDGRNDPQQPIRQQTYIRALEAHIPEFKAYYGHFLTHQVRRKLCTPISGQTHAYVYKTEEKGSDVNLATHLLNDSWLDRYDCAVLISNDSDLVESLKIIKNHHNRVVGLVQVDRLSKELSQHATFIRTVRRGALYQCQLPNPIPGTSIRKPHSW